MCQSGVCNNQGLNTCTDEAETLELGDRCFSDAMCKGYEAGNVTCNRIGVNECREVMTATQTPTPRAHASCSPLSRTWSEPPHDKNPRNIPAVR